MLYVMASVQPPKGKQKTVKINYIISPSNVTFSDLPENKKHVVVDCMVVAFDKDGKEVAHASDTLDGAIPQAAYDAVMKQGLPANQEIELKPGTYNLRLGVMDHATQQIGTVDVPLEISDSEIGNLQFQVFSNRSTNRADRNVRHTERKTFRPGPDCDRMRAGWPLANLP